MRKLWQDFKAFAVKGNMIDLAVGIIIGAAFTSVVNSLVNDIIMPPIGQIFGGADFSNLFINLSGGEFDSLAAAQEAGAATINVGLFINAIINFLIVGFSVFMIVRFVQRLEKQYEHFEHFADKDKVEEAPAEEPTPPEPTPEEKLTEAINKLNALIEKKL